jgi:hypothetical protein
MDSKFYTIRFKEIELGLGHICIYFLSKIYLEPYHFMKKHLDRDPLPPLHSGRKSLQCTLMMKVFCIYGGYD